MSFLCEKHKQWLFRNPPTVSEQTWHRFMLHAKKAMNCSDWSTAISSYGSAFDISDLLLTLNNFSEQAQIRYTHSCTKLACALNLGKKDLDWLIQSVNKRLSDRYLTAPLNSLSQELQRIKATPCDLLKLERIEIDNKHGKTLH